jgi:hypothetical protein
MGDLSDLQAMAADLEFAYHIESVKVEPDHLVITFRLTDDSDEIPETKTLYIDPRIEGLGKQVLMVLHQLCQLVNEAYVVKRRPADRRPGHRG